MPEAVLPLQLVRVSGPSMAPALRSGDVLLVWRGAPIRPGDVVLACFPSLPDTLVVKRAVTRTTDGWVVASDNDAAGGDSRTYGPAHVFGRAVLLLPVPRASGRVVWIVGIEIRRPRLLQHAVRNRRLH